MARRARDTLGDLARLREALKAEQAQRERAEQEAKREAARREAEATLFRRVVNDVAPLSLPPKASIERPSPTPIPSQRLADEERALQEALSDEFDAESLLDTDAELAWQRPPLGPDIARRLRRGQWVIQDQLDLHGARVDEARELLGLFLRDCIKRGIRCVRVIHGKGLGSRDRQPVLKGKVRRWLIQRDEVIAFCQATARDGGAGALVVLLRATR
ncbi:MAG TPA: Smr/MutS family protein [Burkholderiaceae bacterium]|nr:Smr/MutS family protein [Burkholderiaceae bacterium]